MIKEHEYLESYDPFIFFRLKVDLQKAQSACEQLSEQLMNAEAAKEKFEAEATNFREDAELARKAKEVRIFFIFICQFRICIGILIPKLF